MGCYLILLRRGLLWRAAQLKPLWFCNRLHSLLANIFVCVHRSSLQAPRGCLKNLVLSSSWQCLVLLHIKEMHFNSVLSPGLIRQVEPATTETFRNRSFCSEGLEKLCALLCTSCSIKRSHVFTAILYDLKSGCQSITSLNISVESTLLGC